MLTFKDEGIILDVTDNEFESSGVLNPGCIVVDSVTRMFYRATKPGNFSTIGYCELLDNKVVNRATAPVLYPEYDYEKQGLEDPRIIELEGTYYLFYTAFDGINARIAYATSHDLKHFEKHGIISPQLLYDEAIEKYFRGRLAARYASCKTYCVEVGGRTDILLWDKDGFVFPRKIQGRYALMHRILPDIQIAYFDDFVQLTSEDYWRKYLKNLEDYIVLEPRYNLGRIFVGGGCPPIETAEGWLLIYHEVEETYSGRIYRAEAALLALDNPLKVIARLSEPLFSPATVWEKVGNVNNVIFPTGAVVRDGRLHIYYGAADRRISAKSVEIAELLRELGNHRS